MPCPSICQRSSEGLGQGELASFELAGQISGHPSQKLASFQVAVQMSGHPSIAGRGRQNAAEGGIEPLHFQKGLRDRIGPCVVP